MWLVVGGLVLVSKGVSSNDDWLLPAWDVEWDVVDDDWLTEDGSSADVSDGSVGRLPHLLEVEFLDSGLIWGDGGTLDSDLACLDSLAASIVTLSSVASRFSTLKSKYWMLRSK